MGGAESKIEEEVPSIVQPMFYVGPMKDIIKELHRDRNVQEELEQERIQTTYDKLKEQLDENNFDNQKPITIETLHTLARKVIPLDLSGRTIGLFGMSLTGKSSTVNALLDSKVAGVDVSTKEIITYDGEKFRLYDLPGQNDDLSYFDKEYIALMKGLTHRLVLITESVKEVEKLLNLFEDLDLPYDIVINKFDTIDFEERAAFREQINEEIEEYQLNNIHHVWFISANHPELFKDWRQMVRYLTT